MVLIFGYGSDMKPENAMGGITKSSKRESYVKIVDFGAAKHFEQVATGSNEELKSCRDTDHKDLVLTMSYASVETLAACANDSVAFNPFLCQRRALDEVPHFKSHCRSLLEG